MDRNMYHPSDNYERNFLLVKQFGSKPIIFIVPFLLLLYILGVGYISATKNEFIEVTLLQLVTSDTFNHLQMIFPKNALIIISSLTSLFFIFGFLSFYFTCKDPSPESVPDLSLSLMYGWSMLQLLFFVLMFASASLFSVIFIFKKPEHFEALAEHFSLTVSDVEAYKPSIIVILLLLCAILFIMMWFSVSQVQFIKSIKSTLMKSVAQNKGAHTYGVFSMMVAVSSIIFAGIMTFLYYCYKDALSGFGITMNETYVYISLMLSYIRGLIPFCVSICALIFSEMTEEANTMGTIYYNDIETLGTVTDPNMNRKKSKDKPKINKIN